MLAFAAPGFGADAAPLRDQVAAFPNSVLVGCSTSGEIDGSTVQDDIITLAVARFAHSRLRRAFTPVAGQVQHLPAGVLLTGCLAGDGPRFEQPWILDRGAPAAQQVCAVGFHGVRLRVGHGCDGGWSDFGPERRDEPGADTLVRTILGIDEARQSLTFAGDIPEGGVARLMRATTDKLVDSAGLAARTAAAGVAGVGDALIVSVSCVGRRLVLGERSDEEVETVQDSAPARSAHVGFYSYGEISPALPGSPSDLHNQTMTVTVFSEA